MRTTASFLPGFLQRLLMLPIFAVMVLLTGCSPQLSLYSGLSESDANEILSALVSAGIPVEKISQKEGYSIQVPAPRSADAFSTLTAQGLPRTKQNGMGQVFKKEGLISSPMEERVRYLYALSQELERTLSSMDGVVVARVHIVLPERLTPGEPIVPSSAAVFIKHQADVNFGLHTGKIRSLVFNSIPGLSGDAFEKVTIVSMPAAAATAPTASVSVLGPLQYETRNRVDLIVWGFGLTAVWFLSLLGAFYLARRRYASGRSTSTTGTGERVTAPASSASPASSAVAGLAVSTGASS